ncbi:hypothetical protein [Actinokineospora xionganensis]|uniref:Uncharacterized protein n=1 Tax=Actinokineospora xionganensis TaxID=2684470 RepID=A0ABR7LF52_9PSEU|nr:hypothetical protein [Actinokineospora xionganensis]MBC6450907.1 hypothetical protein [Actinokineospora xionganensis]
MATTQAAYPTDYTPDRHTALHLVNTGQIVATEAILRRPDGRDLDPGVFAALMRLARAGYVEARLPQTGNPAAVRDWPARLTVAGIQMLTRFARPTAGSRSRASQAARWRARCPVPDEGSEDGHHSGAAVGHQQSRWSLLRRSRPRRVTPRSSAGDLRAAGRRSVVAPAACSRTPVPGLLCRGDLRAVSYVPATAAADRLSSGGMAASQAEVTVFLPVQG